VNWSITQRERNGDAGKAHQLALKNHCQTEALNTLPIGFQVAIPSSIHTAGITHTHSAPFRLPIRVLKSNPKTSAVIIWMRNGGVEPSRW